MTNAQTSGTTARLRILVGLDGSPVAESILRTVRGLAARIGADIVLLHVVPVSESLREVASQAGVALDEVATHERAGADVYLERVAAKLRDKEVAVRTATAIGEAATEIVRYAEREAIDLIALATHGRSGAQRWLHGSVADAVLHNATTPLLLMRPTQGTATPIDVRHVMIALDGSEVAEAALPIAERFARALAVPLVLVRVIEISALAFTGDAGAGIAVDYQRLFDMLRDDAERYLTSWANGLRGRDITVEVSVVAGIAADAIVAAARTHPGTLLVLSTHGRTGWRAVALGSVARRVVSLAGSPVLIIRAGQTTSAPA